MEHLGVLLGDCLGSLGGVSAPPGISWGRKLGIREWLGLLSGACWGSLGPSWGPIGPSWASRGPSWSSFGGLLGRLGNPLGRLGRDDSPTGEHTKNIRFPTGMGRFLLLGALLWCLLEPLGVLLGAFRTLLGGFSAPPGATWGRKLGIRWWLSSSGALSGPSWGLSWAVLGPSWAVLELSGAVLGPSGARPGPYWGGLGSF